MNNSKIQKALAAVAESRPRMNRKTSAERAELEREARTLSESCEGCVHRHYVRADPYGTSMNGWGCLLSGGHAIKRCASFR